MSPAENDQGKSEHLRLIRESNPWGMQIGIEPIEAGPERVVSRLQVEPKHHQPYGILHGGVYASIVEDVASVGAGMAARARGQAGIVGVNNSTDFLRSHGEGELIAEGKPIHVGRSQQIWSVEIRRSSDQKLVARGQVRFHVLDELPRQALSRSDQ
jgi:1,4-dihydroxy-2-naphthoyl-CoA hydrolase